MTDSESNGEKFRFFYSHLVGDIENTKKRQWSVPYYILLLFAAIIGFVKLLGENYKHIWLVRYSLSAVALIIAIAGIWHIIDIHFLQAKYRRHIYKLAHSNRQFAYHFHLPQDKNIRTGYYLNSFTVFFSLVVIVGLVCVFTFLRIPWPYSAFPVAACIIFGCLMYREGAISLDEELPISSLKPTEKVCSVCGDALPKQ